MRKKNAEHYFLKGGGEMGELIRAKDWSKTSLGDPADWPQSLCTMVAVMLDNPFGMYIAWGNEYIQLYNDGYRPILGATKHPQALGIGTRETFSEIWHIVESMFDGVMKGKAVGVTDFMFRLNRYGFEEECYFDFSYSPIRKDNGEVGGVLVTVIETTEKKRATDALKESNVRYINNIMQAPVAMCILRGENHVVEIANEQMLNLWGRQADQVMNKPIFEGLPEAKDQGLEALLENVYTTGKKFSANERPVNLPRNGKVETTYVNFVYDALKETDGTTSGIVAIAIEVTPQVVARSKVEESEQKVRALVKNAPFPIAVYVGKEMIVELANPSIINIWGKGNDVIGKSFKDVLPELDNQLVFKQIEKVLTTGESFHTKSTPLDLLVDGNLRTYFFNYSFTALYDVNGNIYGVMNTGVDLTDLNIAKKRIEDSDKRFRNTMQQAPVGITILRGPQYIAEMANDAYLQLVDKKESEFVGNPLFASLPEVEEAVHSLLDNVLNTGVPYHGNEVPIPVNRYGKQDVCYFDFLYHPLKEEDGIISGVIAIVTEVTEKVEARKTIEERKRLYEAITQNTPDLIYVFDLNYRFTYANEALLNMWGRTWDDAIGKAMSEVGYEPWHAEMHRREIDQVIATKKSVRGEVSFPHATLGNRIYDYIFAPVIDRDGKVEAVAGTSRDITPQVEARKLIEESEEKFRLLADSMPQQIWTSDPEGNLNYYNQSVFNYSGLTIEQINKDGWIQIVHPDDREENIRKWMDSIASGEDFLVEHRFRRHDGAYRWQLSRAIPQKHGDGKIQMWVGTSTDIQEHKTFARELEKKVISRTAELKTSEEKFYTLFNLSPICKTLSDAHSGKIVMVNDAFSKFFGYSREEALDKSSAELGLLDLQEREIMINELQANGKIVNKELWFIKKSGERCIALASAEVISMGDKQFFLSAFNDISEIKKAEQNIKQKNIELEKMNKELQSFAYISSHDLQEPLRKIQTFATRITEKEEKNLSDSGKYMFNRMQDAAKRMQTLIQDLLAYSRTTTTESKFETADLNEIIAEVKEDLKEELKGKHATIEANQLCDADIIPFQFRQLMHNLIGNALKFSSPNNPPIIKIKSEIASGIALHNQKLSPKNRYCHITVSDNGIGFEQQYSERIFEVFQRLHGKSEYEGTGIGLSIVKKIVENHNGIITATGELNKGATFDIYIPST